MRRIALVSLLSCAGALAVAAPASADFHGLCPGGGASAEVDMQTDGSGLTFSGSVSCKGADAVTITSLTLTSEPLGTSVAEAPQASCTAPCADPVSTSATTSATPGVYEVRMKFTVVTGTKQAKPQRFRQWAYLGGNMLHPSCPFGQPVRQLTSGCL